MNPSSVHDAEPRRLDLPHDLPRRAVELAAEILRASRARESAADRRHAGLMARMVDDEPGKKFTILMTDQVLKMEQPDRAARRLSELLRDFGLPSYLTPAQRTLLWAGAAAARLLPSLVMPLVTRQVRSQSRHVIISAEPRQFANYVAQRQADGFTINFNQLGEAVLGDCEAARRLAAYVERLRGPDIAYCSVKLSSVVSQISLTGYATTLAVMKDRLRTLYRAAMSHPPQGRPRFVNLDMEEYRDLDLTTDAFTQVLDEPEFERLEAGIVLQAYLPDSFPRLERLTAWARRRHERTGVGIKIRVVKGANLAMEQVEAALREWEQAPYRSKVESDANFKRMIEFASRPENARVVRVGIASHNLFDIAWALLVRNERGVADRLEFEMLEGMANPAALEVRQRAGGLTIYTPAVADQDFEAAVAYLIRRLDENTAPGSFLGALFGLQEGSQAWREQSERFLQACRLAQDPALSRVPNRRQNRLNETIVARRRGEPFRNAPDTDFSLPANREWADGIVRAWRERRLDPLPVFVGDRDCGRVADQVGRDPSRPEREVYRYAAATLDDVHAALDVAVRAQPAWAARDIAERGDLLRQIAAEFARRRGDSIGAMLIDAGKSIVEADVEVSEAVDFANYYADSLDDPGWFDGTEPQPLGVVVVTPPWNFPYAIPAGGCLAALMAGNTVVLKPSRESVLTAWVLARQFWDAGVPREVLQFLPVADRTASRQLIVDPRTAAVILTGSYDTARMFRTWRPDLRLFAETSGKNAMIVTAHADLDLAVKDMVRGAFGHSGQKCSATSLALIERPVYESTKFRDKLLDAARSLVVGGAWDAAAVATPVIRPPAEALQRGLTQLDEGESWLLEPRQVGANPCHWSPGIRLGVRPGSWYHRTECFGPVLGLIRVENFQEALAIQNGNEFGLTGGLHSLDPDEIAVWRETVEVGNAYVNRAMTGAIVRRQPFGGWKNSVVGPGAKAGGPNYVATLATWQETRPPTIGADPPSSLASLANDLRELLPESAQVRFSAAARSYSHWWQSHFAVAHDPSQVRGESNQFRYRPRPWHVLRIGQPTAEHVLPTACLAAFACQLAGVRLELSLARSNAEYERLAKRVSASLHVETHESLASRLAAMRDGTVRVLDGSPAEPFDPRHVGNLTIIREPAVANGRIELLHYLREQSISQTTHRYGNIL